ncbi:MAG: PqiC family protein [Alphaproteobacteria bacterium]|nr:PqiC family protein [Alphaproteobacteria bacterium]
MKLFGTGTSRIAHIACLVTALALGACAAQTQPSRFYVLEPLGTDARMAGPDPAAGPRLAIGPVKLPKHLGRTQMVVHRSGNRIDLLEFDRWGEELDENMTRVLTENLSLLVPTDRIAGYPWDRNIPIDYQVTVDVARLAVQTDRRVALIARWRIFDYRKRTLLVSGKSVASETAPGQGSDGVAAALSTGLAKVSRDIAAAVRGLKAGS